jgi:hypothetical protein
MTSRTTPPRTLTGRGRTRCREHRLPELALASATHRGCWPPIFRGRVMRRRVIGGSCLTSLLMRCSVFAAAICCDTAQAAGSLESNTPTSGSRLAVHERCGKSYCGTCAGPRVVKESALAPPVNLGLCSCGLKRSGRSKRSRYSFVQPQHQTSCTCFHAEARGVVRCAKGSFRRPRTLVVAEGPAVSVIVY